MRYTKCQRSDITLVLSETRPPICKRGKIVKKNFLENFGKKDLLLSKRFFYFMYMENEMNIIRFKDKGFILVYPDREEVWNRGIDKGIGVGSSYIRYKAEIYKQSV